MQELEKLKSVLLDLNKNQRKFSAQLREFEALQAQVSVLEQQAQVDPDAGRKVRNVNAFMAHEGQHAQRQILTQVGVFQSQVMTMREQLDALTGLGPEPLAQAVPSTPMTPLHKKQNRNFA